MLDYFKSTETKIAFISAIIACASAIFAFSSILFARKALNLSRKQYNDKQPDFNLYYNEGFRFIAEKGDSIKRLFIPNFIYSHIRDL